MPRSYFRAGRHPDKGFIAEIRSCLLPVGHFILLALLVTTLSRLGLSLWKWYRVSDVEGWTTVFVQGLRFDFVLLGLLLALPLLVTPLACTTIIGVRLWRKVLQFVLTFGIVFIAFMELATPFFIFEYDLRPNILFVKYLIYPREVASMLWTGYKLPLAIAAIVVPATAWLAFRIFANSTKRMMRVPVLQALVAVPLLALICTIAMRSSFGHRPVNPSDVAFSTDPLVNMLPLPSAYSAIYGAYEMRHEGEGQSFGHIETARVIEIMRKMSGAPDNAFKSEELPSLRLQSSPVPARKNLVIILEESLGARFVGALGGLPLTPNLDRYSKEGIWFSNLYATGTRSARGIEAVITGFLPTTTESVVKLGGAQQDFFTLAEFLRARSYDTSFIYGGSAQFDNMRRFFMGNGFGTVIDEADYDDPEFSGSWGVSDQDLFRMADSYFDKLPRDKPFFSLVFSSSNHTPFEYPDDTIEPYNEPAATRENAIKYADHAVGQFIEEARRSEYWDDTLFLIVADHDSRVLGAELVPVRHFHVPAVIIGKDIRPQRIDRVASQVDLIPTLIPLLGVSGQHPATGLDLLSENAAAVPPHAVMRYGNNIAYREDDDVIIFQPNRNPLQFRYRDGQLIPNDTVDPSLVETGLAHATWPLLAYREHWYRLPGQEPVEIGVEGKTE